MSWFLSEGNFMWSIWHMVNAENLNLKSVRWIWCTYYKIQINKIALAFFTDDYYEFARTFKNFHLREKINGTRKL